jgi:hypothetical protein
MMPNAFRPLAAVASVGSPNTPVVE